MLKEGPNEPPRLSAGEGHPAQWEQLSAESWSRRHLTILVILWVHVPALYIVGLQQGYGPVHPFLETAVVAIFAAAASVKGLSRDVRASFATLGLVSSSAILVHLTGGLIEMHFHFFVMVAVVALYQSWYPFLLAIGFVLLHHGVVGAIDSSSVFNHAAALRSPWKWAALHALFIAGESVAALTTWKLNELSLDAERSTRTALEVAIDDLSEAQALTHIGSWDWDLTSGHIDWSDELYRICGVPSDFEPSYENFIAMIPVPERSKLENILEYAVSTGDAFEFESRLSRPDGTDKAHPSSRTVRHVRRRTRRASRGNHSGHHRAKTTRRKGDAPSLSRFAHRTTQPRSLH